MIDLTWLRENALSDGSINREFSYDNVIDGDWTAEDEAALQATEQCVTFRSFDACDDEEILDRFLDELAACRIIGSLYGLEPSSLVSARHHLHAPGPWSACFSQLLTKVAVQPFFEAEASSLVVAVQYAVICRTDSRQPWPLADTTDDRFLSLVRDEVALWRDGDDADNLSISSLRRLATKRWENKHRDRPTVRASRWCLLFTEIEKLSERDGTSHDGGAYPVTKDDLHVVLTAVSQIEAQSRAYSAFGCRQLTDRNRLDEWYASLRGQQVDQGPIASIPPLTLADLRTTVIGGMVKREREHAKLEKRRARGQRSISWSLRSRARPTTMAGPSELSKPVRVAKQAPSRSTLTFEGPATTEKRKPGRPRVRPIEDEASKPKYGKRGRPTNAERERKLEQTRVDGRQPSTGAEQAPALDREKRLEVAIPATMSSRRSADRPAQLSTAARLPDPAETPHAPSGRDLAHVGPVQGNVDVAARGSEQQEQPESSPAAQRLEPQSQASQDLGIMRSSPANDSPLHEPLQDTTPPEDNRAPQA